MLTKNKEASRRNIAKILLLTIASILTSPVITGIASDISVKLFCKRGCELEGIGYALFGALCGLILIITLLYLVSTKVLKSRKLGLIPVFTFILYIIATLLIYKINTHILSQDMKNTYEQTKGSILNNAQKAKIGILDFSEEANLDNEENVKSLTVKVKLISSTEITINDPFSIAIINPDYHTCAYTKYPTQDRLAKYELKEGINEIQTVIEGDNLLLNYPYFKGQITGKYLIALNFYAYLPGDKYRTDVENNQGNAGEIYNTLNYSDIPLSRNCSLNENMKYDQIDVAFESKTYKIKATY